MANVTLKTDFKNGEKLFDYQLNNNFAAIQAALDAMNKIVWQDEQELPDSILAFRGTTEELMNREIIDGQLLYDVNTGETYIDYEGERISTGGGNAIYIGEDEPNNPSTQIWITPSESVDIETNIKYRDKETGEFKDTYSKSGDTLPVGSVVEYDGEEVPAGWEEIESDKAILFSDDSGIIDNIVLNESNSNFEYIDLEYKCNTYGYKTTRLYNSNGKNIVLDYTTAASSNIVQTGSSNYLISGVNITLQSSCMINHQNNGGVVTEIGNNLIKITKVIGYNRHGETTDTQEVSE